MSSSTHRHLPVLGTEPEVLPPRYARWMESLLGASIPRETEATCSDCAMVVTTSETQALPGSSFHPDLKCCTYTPELPNFLVGSVLRDTSTQSPHGRETMIRRIEHAVGVSPLGVLQTEYFKQMFRSTSSGFGRSRSLLCPHYVSEDGGRCGIWQYREAMCATWYCKHVRGAVSRAFWTRTHQLLAGVERALARWCCLTVGISPEALRTLYPTHSPREHHEVVGAAELDGQADPQLYASVWGEWRGREQDYFIACANAVDALSWGDVMRICGSEVGVYAEIVRAAFARLQSSAIPTRVRPGSFQVVGMTSEVYRVVTYSVLDPRDLPRALVEAIPLFAGRPTMETLAYLQESMGMPVTEDDVRKMVDFQLLLPESVEE